MSCYLLATNHPSLKSHDQGKFVAIAPKPAPSSTVTTALQIQNNVSVQQAINPAPNTSNIANNPNKIVRERVQYEPEDPLLADDFNEYLNFDISSTSTNGARKHVPYPIPSKRGYMYYNSEANYKKKSKYTNLFKLQNW